MWHQQQRRRQQPNQQLHGRIAAAATTGDGIGIGDDPDDDRFPVFLCRRVHTGADGDGPTRGQSGGAVLYGRCADGKSVVVVVAEGRGTTAAEWEWPIGGGQEEEEGQIEAENSKVILISINFFTVYFDYGIYANSGNSSPLALCRRHSIRPKAPSQTLAASQICHAI
jgi:hypothetical protein